VVQSRSYHFTSNTDFYMCSALTENGKWMDALHNTFKPCFIVNEMVHMHRFDPTNHANHLDEQYVLENLMELSFGSQKIMNEPNAGGSSMSTEVLSFETLHRMYGAELEATEMDIEYCPMSSKKTDYSVKISGTVFGVSVTRAFNYLGKNEFTPMQARYLLMKKLNGVIHSTKNVVTKYSWNKQILHVYTDTLVNSKILRNEYLKLKKEYRINTIVIVTVAQNADYLFKKVKHVKLFQKGKTECVSTDDSSLSDSDEETEGNNFTYDLSDSED